MKKLIVLILIFFSSCVSSKTKIFELVEYSDKDLRVFFEFTEDGRYYGANYGGRWWKHGPIYILKSDIEPFFIKSIVVDNSPNSLNSRQFWDIKYSSSGNTICGSLVYLIDSLNNTIDTIEFIDCKGVSILKSDVYKKIVVSVPVSGTTMRYVPFTSEIMDYNYSDTFVLKIDSLPTMFDYVFDFKAFMRKGGTLNSIE